MEPPAVPLVGVYGASFTVQLHPSDLIVTGKAEDAAHVRAILAEKLLFSPALLTWDEEANAIERDMKRIWIAVHDRNREADTERLFVDLAPAQNEIALRRVGSAIPRTAAAGAIHAPQTDQRTSSTTKASRVVNSGALR